MNAPDFARQFGVNAAYVEKVFADWQRDPEAVGEEWRRFFEGLVPEADRPRPATRRAEPAAAPPAEPVPEAADRDEFEALRGIAGRIARNMEESLQVPTATSAREVPVKVLEENRRVLNSHLAARYLGKVSFTHLIAWAMVQAIRRVPAMASSYVLVDGRPHRRRPRSLNLGLAIDLAGRDGSRTLVVPNVKDVGSLDFDGFLAAYNDQLAKARQGKLTPEDFADTTFTLTNPGTIGTVSSLPRLMQGQAFILASGAIAVPAPYQGAAPSTLSELAVSKVMTLTSTYDHRVIQGAESGMFLDWMHRLLVGEEEFYAEVFRALRVPYRPVHFARDRRPPLGSPMREAESLERAAQVMTYIRSYRVRGYLLANLDPLEYRPRDYPELALATYGLTLWDKDREFFSAGVTPRPFARLREIQEVLQATYTRHVGVEFMHIADPEQRQWLRQRLEGTHSEEELPRETMLSVLDQLVEAEAFEQFLHKRFVGHKRFSLEGGETLIPTLHALLDRAGEHGVGQAVLGMAHRGRLNVLAHVLRKPLTKIFSEFEGYLDPESSQGSGDVKYHLGTTATYRTSRGSEIDLELASNPSHLEAVDPVVEGMARARQELFSDDHDRARASILPILIHGDAAFAGQGVVMETLNMSQLRGYRTGGTVHLIVNNQIGYTTLPEDARSSPFCTDVAKAIQAPIFHVNGDDPLAAVRMVRLCMDYRQHFQRDVVLDIVCYRRHGHNEGDEPSYTQPLMYRAIEQHQPVRQIYQEFLIRAGVLDQKEAEAFDRSLQERLRQSLDEVRSATPPPVELAPPAAERPWRPPAEPVPLSRLRELTDRLLDWPAEFRPHPKITGVLGRRREMMAGEQPVDFATAESLAFATLLVAGVPVRLAGQDSGRGTFSQRHSVLVDVETGAKYIPLNFLAEDQARYSVIDSLLSEEAALGFEYGYSVERPEGLTMWEAQFGDFCNGAQIQIDQFLAAGEAKWGTRSGLTLLLPHGYDGQGPEHSSARLERFLQLCAEENLRVANPSTPAQYYHLLRGQALDPRRVPLVVMTPKSLLRRREAGSRPEELAEGAFAAVLDDPAADPSAVQRVVCCSGKVYYDLLAARGDDPTTALLRIELLYPWPEDDIAALRQRYGKAAWIWCQEEPANMGAWSYLRHRLPWQDVASRPASASPATGSLHRHKAEQAELVRRALGGRVPA